MMILDSDLLVFNWATLYMHTLNEYANY